MIKDVQIMQWRMEHISIHGSAFYAIVLHKSATFVSKFSGARNNSFENKSSCLIDVALHTSQ